MVESRGFQGHIEGFPASQGAVIDVQRLQRFPRFAEG